MDFTPVQDVKKPTVFKKIELFHVVNTAEATCYGCHERINNLYISLVSFDCDFDDTELMLKHLL